MENQPNILILYTGGTIGMIKDSETGELKAFDFDSIYNHVPELQRLNCRLVTKTLGKPIDSSEMNPKHWKMIAATIYNEYENYDGFVILHGSDTMAYTASALSFMLQGLKKPVILTGSQLPIGTIRTDGKENLITAIEIAADKLENGEPIIQEVAVYFEYSLYRGNRSSKVSANQFEAFSSPNYPELAVAGVTINYDREKLFRTGFESVQYFGDFSNQVALLKLFPGCNYNFYREIFSLKNNKVVVLETFGSGNAPADETLQQLVSSFIEEGGMVVNITQCSSGFVIQGKYETSSFFSKAGVVSGGDLTTEAALTKLMYGLGKGMTSDELSMFFLQNIVGERTTEIN